MSAYVLSADQQVHLRLLSIPPENRALLVDSHDDSREAVDGQLLGYSVDAVNDYAIVSDPIIRLRSQLVT